MEHFCYNHPERKAYSICHYCGKSFCEDCLVDGGEYYYCKNPECLKFLSKKTNPDNPEFMEVDENSELSKDITCPSCGSELELSEEERESKKIHCPECEAFIDFTFKPPKVLEVQNYTFLLSSLNQGDIGLIKSILDDNEIDYYVNGDNFLSVRPLLEPVQFYVNANQFEEARNLLKDFDLKIFGFSARNED